MFGDFASRRDGWLHGIKGLHIASQGHVHWKGQRVEHYDRPWAFTTPETHAEYIRERYGGVNLGSEKSGREAAEELAARCRHLEAIGVPVNSGTACWYWDWFAPMTAGHPYKCFLARLFPMFEHEDGRIALVVREELDPNGWPVRVYVVEVAPRWETPLVRSLPVRPCETGYHALVREGYAVANCGQRQHLGVCLADLAGVTACLERHGVTPALAVRIPDMVGPTA